MTLRQVYEFMLIDINKTEAPSLLLEDFNYLINKAVQQKVNKDYQAYAIDQLFTDSLRVLQTSAQFDTVTKKSNILGTYYEINMPNNYLHLLNCICGFEPIAGSCKASTIYKSATRLTADLYAGILNNHYFKPSYKRPYFYLQSKTTSTTNSDTKKTLISVSSVSQQKEENVEVIEIRCGNSPELKTVNMDYLKTPMHLQLTQEQLDLTTDNSQKMEFPDYVCQEIINELVKLQLENSSDPRLQTNLAVNQSLVSPIQQGQK